MPIRHIELVETHRAQGISGDAKLVASQITMSDSKINGGLIFCNIIFQRLITFDRSVFSKYVEFRGSQFDEDAEFKKTQFKGDADFSRSQFNKNAYFSGSQFFGYAYFRDSQFKGDAYVNESQFFESAYFSGSQFNKNAYFSGSQFSGDILTFRNAVFRDSFSQEDACRRAKNILEKNGNRDESGYHLYREMEGKRRQKPWYIRYPEFVLFN